MEFQKYDSREHLERCRFQYLVEKGTFSGFPDRLATRFNSALTNLRSVNSNMELFGKSHDIRIILCIYK